MGNGWQIVFYFGKIMDFMPVCVVQVRVVGVDEQFSFNSLVPQDFEKFRNGTPN